VPNVGHTRYENTCPKAKPQVNEIQRAKRKGEACTSIKSLLLLRFSTISWHLKG